MSKELALTSLTQTPTQTQTGVNDSSASTRRVSYPPASAEFDQLVQSSELFWEKLREFHFSQGKKYKIPSIGGKTLDLPHLFREVTSRGGIEKVISDRRWKEVVQAFNFPSTLTSASFVLRKYYYSLLSDFEQVYYFRREGREIPVNDTKDKNLVNGSAQEQGTAQLQGQVTQNRLELGMTITGTIDNKFDEGYFVTFNLGSEILRGVMYHQPVPSAQISTEVPTQRHRKRSKLVAQDPFRPKSNRSGYNFFFAENYARLRPLYSGQERAITSQIGQLWNDLRAEERQVYQDKGLEDKKRYQTEMMEYKAQQ